MRNFCVLLVLVSASCSRHAATARPDYTATSEVVLSGTVERVMLNLHEGPPVVHLIVGVNGKDVVVHVAPPEFLREHGVEYHPSDHVRIIAALQTDEPHYHARSITRDDQTLTLRDGQGFALWDPPRNK